MVIKIVWLYNKNSFAILNSVLMSANLLRKEQSIDENDNQSNVILSYSRLAQQVDKLDELQKDNNQYDEKIPKKGLQIKNKQGQQQQFVRQQQLEAWDGELIKVMYVKISTEKGQNNTEGTYKMEQKCIINKNVRYNINGRLIDSGELNPIAENELENKKSDEQITEKQIIFDSKAAIIGKRSGVQHVTQSLKSGSIIGRISSIQPPHPNKLKGKQVRTLQESFEVDDKKNEKMMKQIQDRNIRQNEKFENMNKSKQSPKCVLSSFSTASKLQKFRNKQSKTQENLDKINDQQYLVFLKNISKRLIGLENELQSFVFKNHRNISLKKEMSSSKNVIKTNSRPQIFINEDRDSRRFDKNRSSSIVDRRSSIFPRSETKKQKFVFDFTYFKDQNKRKNNKITKQILFQLFTSYDWVQTLKGSFSIQSIISLIGEVFKMYDNSIKLLSKQPLAVIFESFNLIALLSYSRKIYFGQFIRDKANLQKNGYGVEIDPGKSIYIGEFKQGIKHGFGFKFIQGVYFYKGQWTDDKFSGKGRLECENGNIYEGNFLKGNKQGFGKEHFKNGQQYEGFFKVNRFNGKGSYRWENGSSYEGDFLEGCMHGKGKWISSQGDIYEGEYCLGLKEGWGTYKWKNGSIYIGQFYKGSPVNTTNKNQRVKIDRCIQKVKSMGEIKKFNVFFNF